MSDLGDRELLRAPAPDEPGTPKTGSNRAFLVAGVGGLLLGVAASVWWWRSEAPLPPRNAAPPGTEGVLAEKPKAPELPPLDQMDTYLRVLLGALSSRPELASWLATDNLIRQMADGVDRISRGQSPAKNLAVIQPKDAFEIRGAPRQLAIDPRSYRRYDGLAAVVTSLNPDAVARAYRTIQPRLNEAYRALGRSESNVDNAVAISFDVLLATPAPQDPIRLVPGKGATYAFADPRLESLAPIQKQLVRMGPDNAARIKEKLQAIKNAIANTASGRP